MGWPTFMKVSPKGLSYAMVVYALATPSMIGGSWTYVFDRQEASGLCPGCASSLKLLQLPRIRCPQDTSMLKVGKGRGSASRSSMVWRDPPSCPTRRPKGEASSAA